MMGSKDFEKEYIEYLQEQNRDLLRKLNHLKGKYESKMVSKGINNQYLEDMLKICTALPQEIDLFYDKVTVALDAFKDILLRKSEMVIMAEKIIKAINPSGKFETSLVESADPSLINEEISGSKANKKVGTVKVSPMIKGHVISTEPKIYLNKVPGEFTPTRRNESRGLSPIVEASPDTRNDPSSLSSNTFSEIEIPLERIYIKHVESPKTRFKGPKIWRKSISSLRHLSDSRGKSFFFQENDNSSKKLSVEDNELAQVPGSDPLERPSWLYEENSGMNSSNGSFVEYKRRKRRFASVFHSPEDYLVYTEERAKKTPSSFKKRSRVSKRKLAKEKNSLDSSESERDSREEMPTFLNSKNSSKNSSYSDSSDEGDSKEKSLVKEPCRKVSLKPSVEGMSTKLPFERRSRCDELESGTEKSTADVNMEGTSGKATNEMLVKLEDCSSVEKTHLRRSMKNASNQKSKFKRNKAKSVASLRDGVTLEENGGRKRRKAAPSFKLVEPRLNSKLRRN